MKYATLSFILLVACSKTEVIYDAQVLIDESIEAHGANFHDRIFSFQFREINYSVLREKNRFIYTRSWEHDSIGVVKDVLVNSSNFTRIINGDTTDVTEDWVKKYTSSVNSVLYFFQVPYVLNDRGAIKKYLGKFEMKGIDYLGVQVTFTEDGGGEDHEDVFIYWLHPEKKTVDYFAYSYLTDGGGVRFREAINRREIHGFKTQDYVNYKADKGTPLNRLPELFRNGKLKELSLIENENVRLLNP